MDRARAGQAIIVMGVSGCGKSSVGALLASKLGQPFIEGDVLHPESNVKKMAEGTPLTDDDRWPWLDVIGNEISTALSKGEGIIISCSALKKIYRDHLRKAAGGKLAFVFLEGTPDCSRNAWAPAPATSCRPPCWPANWHAGSADRRARRGHGLDRPGAGGDCGGCDAGAGGPTGSAMRCGKRVSGSDQRDQYQNNVPKMAT